MMTLLRPSLSLFSLVVSVLVLSQAVGTAQRAGAPPPVTKSNGQQAQATPQATPQRPPSQTPSAQRFLSRGGELFWKEDRFKKELSLSESQVRDIDRIFADRVKRITPFYEQWEKESAELDRLARERVVDDATFTIQVGRVESLRSKLNETRTVMLYQIFRKLTPEQYKKLQEMRDRDNRGRGGLSGPRAW